MGSWVRTITTPFRKACTIFGPQKDGGGGGKRSQQPNPAEDPESDSIVYGCSDDGTARRRRRREGQAARGGDGVRLRRRAGHVVHARPDNKDWGSQWQLVTAGNCPFMHFPRATKVEMQTWCT
ncbi:hypothetical protein ZEAMMB73_Zm00001d040545 [Zea mays]|uniref:Uncharacterized protein n=1 Tax=Zea mays TaxID=4577 RepID=A0A1D6MRA2_MAIZE|nr:hypothetical protein ZEAMMB73_Zm00001d040545 [Zea mays]